VDRGGRYQGFVQKFHYVRFEYAGRQDEDRSYLRSPPANQLSPSLLSPSPSSSSSSLGTGGRGGVIEDMESRFPNRLLPLSYDGNENYRLDRSVVHIPRLTWITTTFAPLTNTTNAWSIWPAPDRYWLFPVRHDLVAPRWC